MWKSLRNLSYNERPVRCVLIYTFIAYLLFVLADSVMYITIVWWLVKSFKYHRFGVAAILILIVPFIYPLVYAGSLTNLLWMLIFTPFYGLVLMIIVYPILMLLYYTITFGSLLALFFSRRKLGRFIRRSWPVHDNSALGLSNFFVFCVLFILNPSSYCCC